MQRERSIVKSIITERARNAVMEEAGESVSSITNADRAGPTLLLDAIDPDGVRFVKRYCAWLSRGLVSDAYIAARFDRSFQRLRRLGNKSELVLNNHDMPSHWDGPAPDIIVIHAVLSAWSRDARLDAEERRVLRICIHECDVRISNITRLIHKPSDNTLHDTSSHSEEPGT